MDIDRFTKIMMYTTSPNDHEALTAIRTANSLLDKANLTWHDFCEKKELKIVYITPDQNLNRWHQDKDDDTNDTDIEEMLKECLRLVTSPSGQRFIKSLSDWFLRTGTLTDNQKKALKRWYDNL